MALPRARAYPVLTTPATSRCSSPHSLPHRIAATEYSGRTLESVQKTLVHEDIPDAIRQRTVLPISARWVGQCPVDIPCLPPYDGTQFYADTVSAARHQHPGPARRLCLSFA